MFGGGGGGIGVRSPPGVDLLGIVGLVSGVDRLPSGVDLSGIGGSVSGVDRLPSGSLNGLPSGSPLVLFQVDSNRAVRPDNGSLLNL